MTQAWFSSFKNLQHCWELGRETSHLKSHSLSFLRVLIERVRRDLVEICRVSSSLCLNLRRLHKGECWARSWSTSGRSQNWGSWVKGRGEHSRQRNTVDKDGAAWEGLSWRIKRRKKKREVQHFLFWFLYNKKNNVPLFRAHSVRF